MAPFEDAAIPLGSTILVTGVNGYVGSHVADRLLDSGYKVRGTVRDMQKHRWLVRLFNEKYGEGKFELIQVDNIARLSAFDSALIGSWMLFLTK
jgi:nucleoside-diphosphate-sugar epimerase